MSSNYCVYKHTNRINGKVYVGQTLQLPKKRFGKNGNGYKGSTYFWNAIQCYGWENFDHKILKANLTHENADYYEQYYIKKFNSNNSDFGYNLEGGGTTYKIDVTKKSKHMDEIMKYWRYPKKVAQYDLTGNVIKIWKNNREASKALDVQESGITQCCQGKRKRVGKYIFRYIKDNKLVAKIDGVGMIAQYTLNGDFIRLWNFVSQIENELNISQGCVWACCNGKSSRASEFIFRIIDDSKAVPPKIEGVRTYEQYDKDGKYIQSFFSLKEMESEINVDTGGVVKCCSGKQKTSGGYVWRYGIAK